MERISCPVCSNSIEISSISTKQLVEELKLREGVKTYEAKPYVLYNGWIDDETKNEAGNTVGTFYEGQGPATILIVTD